MKKLVLFFLALGTFAVTAQTKEEVAYFQDLFGMDKVQVISSLITTDKELQETFWSLYDAYENERREMGLHRFEMIQKYVKGYANIDADNVGDMVKEAMKQREQREKLISAYYKKFSKQINPVAAAQFYQIEHYFLSEINVAIVEQLPLIGELKN